MMRQISGSSGFSAYAEWSKIYDKEIIAIPAAVLTKSARSLQEY